MCQVQEHYNQMAQVSLVLKKKNTQQQHVFLQPLIYLADLQLEQTKKDAI